MFINMFAWSSLNLCLHARIYLSVLPVFPFEFITLLRPHISFCLICLCTPFLSTFCDSNLCLGSFTHVSMSCGSLIIIDHYDKCSFLHEYFMQGLEMFEACRPSD